MNVTPALPSPFQPPAQQERAAVAGVRAAGRARDATEDAGHQPARPLVPDRADLERLYARADGQVTRHVDGSRAGRAMAAYAAVAEHGERSGLRDLLGFDAYA